ncbi:MAG TPA: hypothetical protein VGZ47_08385 [Gemmataceae bacterium]|jgi:tetratricopeptide (TPR) repeat protein|nr:hypothetical protein [Gemmataceae bacterium]
MNEVPPPDDLESLLAQPSRPAADILREQIQQRTVRQVRKRLWLRRGRLVLALAACYLAGMVTLDLLRGRPERITVELVRVEPASPSRSDLAAKADLQRNEPVRQVELQAEQADPPEQAQAYFAAGKRYATEAGDWDSALRCYRNALDADPQQAAHIDPDNDDWLAMALKLDRQKEKENAKHEN